MTSPQFNWPKKGDRAFRPPVSLDRRACLEAFIMPSSGMYIVGFQQAADMIVDAAQEDGQCPDYLFFPVAYLYRHHLELMLKELVRLGVRMGALEACDDCLARHNLHKLWNRAKEVIKEAWPDSPDDDLRAVEQVIIEFHKLDPSGQAFRYARDTKGNRHLGSTAKHVDMINLKRTVDAVSSFLDASYAGIEDCDPGPL